MGGYKRLLETTFKSLIAAVKDDIPDGVLAVVYDKNFMEASGYAATMAEITGEKVYLVEHYVAGTWRMPQHLNTPPLPPPWAWLSETTMIGL